MHLTISIILLLVAAFGSASDLVKASLIISAGIFALADSCWTDSDEKK